MKISHPKTSILWETGIKYFYCYYKLIILFDLQLQNPGKSWGTHNNDALKKCEIKYK